VSASGRLLLTFPLAIAVLKSCLVRFCATLCLRLFLGDEVISYLLDGSVNNVAGCVVKMKLILCISYDFVFRATQNATGANFGDKCKASKF